MWLLSFGLSWPVTFAVDGVSVVSRCNSRSIETSEALSREVGYHCANRSDHDLSLQVLFYSYPELFTRSPELPFGIKDGQDSDRSQDSTYVRGVDVASIARLLLSGAGWCVGGMGQLHCM